MALKIPNGERSIKCALHQFIQWHPPFEQLRPELENDITHVHLRLSGIMGEMAVENASKKASWLVHVVADASRVLPKFFSIFT